jgi:hypothetical protein
MLAVLVNGSKANIATVHYPSPVQWLADQFASTIASLYPCSEISSRFISVPPFSLDIKRLGTLASPLPLKWMGQEGRSPQKIGNQFIQHMEQYAERAWLMPDFWLHPTGWLYARFSASDLAQWLQTLLFATPTLHLSEERSQSPAIGISGDPVLFQLQYAHARCCSLLKLAQQEKRVQLTEPDLKIAQFAVPISWQNACGELSLQTLSEQRILLALMQFPHSLSPKKQIYGEADSPSPGNQTYIEWPSLTPYWHRQAQQWSTLFLDFYSECRVFGDIQSTAPELLQARLALILILKRVLAFYLEIALQIEAPVIL